MFYIGTADVDLQHGDFRFLLQFFTALHIFVHGKSAHVGNDGLLKTLSKLRYLFANYFLHARILKPDGIEHAPRAFCDARLRISIPFISGKSLDHHGSQHVDIIKISKLVSERKSTAGRDHRIFQFDISKSDARIYHTRSSNPNTGPSLHTRFVPLAVIMEQPMQAPKPQPIRASKENCPSVEIFSLTAFIMGNGPQQ